MGLDIYRRPTQQQIERQQADKEPTTAPPRHNHQNGRDAHVRTGEGGRGTFTHLLRTLYQAVEEAVLVAGTGQQLLMVWLKG